MNATTAVAVGLATLIMVSFAAIPRHRRYVRLAAVLGWALVWLDGKLAGHVADLLGLLVTATSLACLAKPWIDRRRHSAADRPTGRHGNRRS